MATATTATITAPSTPPTPSTPSVVPEITSTSTKVDSEKVWVCIYVDSDDSASAGRATGACELESRVDYYGDDLQDGMQPGNSTSDCAEHCVRRLECSHFTFIWGKCWLKSSSTGREFNSVGVSGECHTDLEVVTSVCANGDASTTATLIGSTAPSTATSVTMATATTATITAPSTPPTPSTPSVVPEITSTSTKVDSEKVWVCIYVDSDDSASAGRATGACELESRVDYYGDDLQDGMQPGNSTSDCAEHCVRRLECSHFTFIWGKCWLKSSSTGREFNSVGVSGECHTDLEVVTSVCANGDASTTATLIGSTAPSTATVTTTKPLTIPSTTTENVDSTSMKTTATTSTPTTTEAYSTTTEVPDTTTTEAYATTTEVPDTTTTEAYATTTAVPVTTTTTAEPTTLTIGMSSTLLS